MKLSKIVCVLGGLFFVAGLAMADVAPVASTNTPVNLSLVGDGLLAGKVLTGVTMRDVINGQYLLGAEATLYKKYYVSADLGLASIVSQANAHALYFINGRVWVGQLAYDNIPLIKQYADATAFSAYLLQYGTVGVWGARDFDYGVWRAGYDLGFTVKLDFLTSQPKSVAPVASATCLNPKLALFVMPVIQS
jgi:hypothetical protein